MRRPSNRLADTAKTTFLKSTQIQNLQRRLNRGVLALNPSRYSLVLLAVWSLAIFMVVKSNIDRAEWTQVVEFGFQISLESQNNQDDLSKLGASDRADPVDHWQSDIQELVNEDIRITSEAWDLMLASDPDSVDLRETLGEVIRRNLKRMQGRIDTCLPDCKICASCDFEKNASGRSSKLSWASPLSQYLDHIQQEIHAQEIESAEYRTLQKRWIESGEQFCSQLAHQIIEWRDFDHGVQARSILEDDKFKAEFSKAIGGLRKSSAIYFSQLDDFISEIDSLSSQHLRELSTRRGWYFWSLIILVVMNYLVLVFVSSIRAKKNNISLKVERDHLEFAEDPLPIGVANANTGEGIHWPIRIAEELLEAAESNSNKKNAGEQALQEYRALSESASPVPDRESLNDSVEEEFQSRELSCLIIEDNDSIRKLMILLLEREGVQCTGLSTNVGLESDEIQKYDLLITDIRLGENITDGVRFVRELRKKGLFIPVLLVSGYRLEGSKHVDVLNGVTHFMGKPIEAEKFIAAVKNLVCVR